MSAAKQEQPVVYPDTIRPSMREQKTEHIIAAARRVFLTSGFDGASMDEIALAASVSKRTVYNRYASKEELFDAVATEACRDIFSFDIEVCYKTPVREFLEDLAIRVLTVKLAPEALALQRLVVFQAPRMPAVGNAYIEHAVQPFVEFVAKYLDQQIALGNLAPLNGVFAAIQFGSMIREPLETQMLMGGQSPDNLDEAIRTQVSHAVDQFLRLHAPRPE